ncbi:MAG: MdtA/MuxA family multidrug efflux RND transporter periplasmic adaptor subunit [Betaproteobacteria bacterium]|nr:MdtA/MuxA family multidrug efflux RND transporter periplasmic adaptor subunit [Betaproteobacteria bacterium]
MGGGAPGKGGGGGGRFGAFDPNRVQPVIAVPARVADINLVQTALGTVAALKVATVKARVDGLLQDVLFREGQIVRAGDVLALIDPKPLQVALSQVEGQLARDQAQLNNARLDLERYRTLLAQDSIAKQQLDAQESLVRQFEGTVKVDQAQVDNARLQLGYTKVSAPIPGRLGLRQVDPGNMIRSSDATGLVVITQIDPITVVFTIPQDNLQRVLKQLKAGEKLAVDAWDREQKNKLATGFLISTDNQIDTTTGTIKLKAQFPNPDGLLFPNQFVNVKMVVDTRKGATVIPLAAIQRGAQGTIVYVVKEDKTTTLRVVKMGPTENDNVAIESGIAPGEVVVTDGIDRLREGAKVEVTVPFVPRQRGPGDPGKRGQWGGKGGGKPAEGAPGSAPAQKAADTKAPEGKPVDSKAPATASVDTKAPAAATKATPDAPKGGGGFRDMTDEQKAEMRKRFEGMTDEQKAEFRKKRQEQRQQNQ